MYSDIALKIFSMINEGIIKSNSQFWKNFSNLKQILNFNIDTQKYKKLVIANVYDLVCIYDDDFPSLPINIRNSEKPFLFAYRGNIKLLNDVSNNVAIIGTLYPTEGIKQREIAIVQKCVTNCLNIVSGLANGCDAIAHSTCLKSNGKTIAFLPTTLNNISPTKNIELAQSIVDQSGLVITEYVTKPKNYYERIQRFIQRDRLQTMFSKAVILIASNRQGEGDSGSRHAMEKAKIYGRKRFVMYNADTDKFNPLFGLNYDLLQDGAIVLSSNTIKELGTK